jgi:acyl-CoA synthetase (NDP forming)
MFPNLTKLIDPSSIAVIGASERKASVGARLMANIFEYSDFRGEVFLINPKRDAIGERRCYASVRDLPYAPDVCMVALPADLVLAALQECGEKRAKFAIVLTSGFGETGEAGKQAELEMKAIALRTGMRIYGPNSPGLSNITKKLGLNFSPAFRADLVSGPIGLVTQGGGLGRTFQQSMERGLGVNMWFSPGNEVDLEVSDFINHMVESPDIRVIAVMLEGIRDGEKMLAAAMNAARRRKPIIVMKLGKSQYGAKAALSHTTAITGAAEVNSAVFRQLGMIEVDDIDEMVDIAALLSRYAPVPDKAIAVYTYSGGTAALAADLVGVAGLEMASFTAATTARLREILPSFAAIDNPVDTTTEVLSNPAIMYDSLKAVVSDPNVALTLVPVPIEMGDTTAEMARAAVRLGRETGAAILPIWMTDRLGAGFHIFAEAGLVPARSVVRAIDTAAHWQDYGRRLQILDTAWVPSCLRPRAPDARPRTRKVWGEGEAKTELAKHGVAVLPSAVCRTPAEGLAFASECGYPVVLKIASADILHKSDIGGVRVGIKDGDELERVYGEILANVHKARPEATIDGVLVERMAGSGGIEVFCGVQRDAAFGHMLTFGAGGIWVELLHDVARRLLPISEQQAGEMIGEIRYAKMLRGYRNFPPADIAALTRLLVAVSTYVDDNAERVEELEINPIWVGPVGSGAMALDAVLITSEVGEV